MSAQNIQKNKKLIQKSTDLSLRWACRSKEFGTNNDKFLFGIVQGWNI